MSSTEFNKIAGAFIGAFLLLLLLNFAAGKIYDTRPVHGHGDEPLGFALAVATDGEAGPAEAGVDYAALVAGADAGKGEKVFNKCKACHVVEDGANRVGPHLWGVVGRDIASAAGFDYSGALAEKEGDWTFEAMTAFLEDPKGWAPGTKMNFGGLKPEDAVNVIVYLNEADGSPVELAVAPTETATDATAGATAPVEKVEDVPHSQDESGSIENAGKRSGDAAMNEGAEDKPAATDEGAKEEPAANEEKSEGTTEEVKTDEEKAGETTAAATSEKTDEATTAETKTEDASAGEKTTEEKSEDTTAEVKAEDTTAATTEKAEGSTDATSEEKTEMAAAETKTEDTAAASGTDMVVISEAFAGGDAEAGEKVFRKCKACHKVEEGKNGVGPSLYGVVGRDIASIEDFNYSKVMSEKEGDWTASNLAAYLADPKGWAPGTKMKFAGLKKEADIVNVIHYLNETDGTPDSLE